MIKSIQMNVYKHIKDKDLRRESCLVHHKPTVVRIAQIQNDCFVDENTKININLYPDVPDNFILSLQTRFKHVTSILSKK